MNLPINEWHDWWRLLLLVFCLVSIVLLVCRFRQHRQDWNIKTKDYWFSILMWVLAGCVISLEGIYRDSMFGPRLVFISAAALVTLKGLCRKGGWGGRD